MSLLSGTLEIERPEKSKHLAYWLLIISLLVAAGWWFYVPVTPPAPLARIESLPRSVVEEPLAVQTILDIQPPVVIAPKQAVKLKAKPAAPQTHKKMAIVRNTQRDSLSDNLQIGFREYQQGNYASSSTAYRRALQQDENNRDALLGLAANSMRRGQSEQTHLERAKQYYTALLDLNPSDAAARAGLAATDDKFAQSNSFSALKEAIQQRPEAAPLHYSLANKYVDQSDWRQAQKAYFKAFSMAPKNADYAFNLAVSLDHLGQVDSALAYYKKALALSTSRPHAIDLSALQQRMQQLQENS